MWSGWTDPLIAVKYFVSWRHGKWSPSLQLWNFSFHCFDFQALAIRLLCLTLTSLSYRVISSSRQLFSALLSTLYTACPTPNISLTQLATSWRTKAEYLAASEPNISLRSERRLKRRRKRRVDGGLNFIRWHDNFSIAALWGGGVGCGGSQEAKTSGSALIHAVQERNQVAGWCMKYK